MGQEDKMGKPGHDTKVARNTAEEGFDEPHDGPQLLSPLTYQGRGGGNPDAPQNIGINAEPGGHTELEPRDPLGILDTIPEGAGSRGKRGGAYGK
jgi:hypothetical protein